MDEFLVGYRREVGRKEGGGGVQADPDREITA